MGEYARYCGKEIKIGTCEDMYYLRFDQRAMIEPKLPGNVNVMGSEVHELRFRFPWPHEDGTDPGAFEQYDKAVAVPGDVPFPDGVEHNSVQFVAREGYLISLPCPESIGLDFHGAGIARNGFRGKVLFSQQKLLRDGTLALICQCGGCGSKYRVESWADAEPIVVACRAEADRESKRFAPSAEHKASAESKAAWWHAIADRISAGYGPESGWCAAKTA